MPINAKDIADNISEEMLEYVAEVPSSIAIDNANQVLQVLDELGLTAKAVVPMGDGGICICWPLEKLYAGINCNNDSSVFLNYRKKGHRAEVSIDGPTQEDYERFKNWLQDLIEETPVWEAKISPDEVDLGEFPSGFWAVHQGAVPLEKGL